jgi:hypothetical protein
MHQSRTAVLIISGSLALGIAACGSSGSSNSASTGAAPAPATTQPANNSQPSDTAAKPVSSSKGLTPPGTHAAFGKAIEVGWVPPSKFNASGPRKAIPLQVTVDGIEKGSMSDLKNIKIEGAGPNSIPYYIKVHVTNLGSTVTGTDNPAIAFRAIDDRGQQQSSVTFLGTFQRCDDVLPPKPFSHGKSFESCLTYLVPGGGSIQEVHWNDGPAPASGVSPYFEKPIVWKGG